MEFEITLRHNGLCASFLCSREVCSYIVISLFSPNRPFPVFSQIKPSNGKTLLYNHVLASQWLHLHNWACANSTCKLWAVTLVAEWADSYWMMFVMSRVGYHSHFCQSSLAGFQAPGHFSGTTASSLNLVLSLRYQHLAPMHLTCVRPQWYQRNSVHTL